MREIEKPIDVEISDIELALKNAIKRKSDMVALRTLIENNGVFPAPVKTTFIAKDFVGISVAIGRDHTATVYLTREDIQKLHHLLGETH